MIDDEIAHYPDKGDRHLYVILNTYGACWLVVDGSTKKIEGLPALLRRGWRPVREVPFAGQSGAYILILLERA